MIPPTPSVPAPIEVEEASGTPPRVWTMRFTPSEVTFTSPGAPDRVVPHDERFTAIIRAKTMFLVAGASPLAFKSQPEVRAKLDAWIGPPTREHLQLRIKKLVRQGLTTGAALVVWALITDGVNGPALFLGLPLLLVGGLSFFVVHRALFAAMALIYGLNVLVLVSFIMAGASPWLWLLAGLILLPASVQFREYQSFAGMREDATTK